MTSVRTRIAAALGVVLVGSATACAATEPGDGGPSIVAGFYPLQFVAERVGGDRVRVANLTQPGAEPHDLELSPRQVGEISGASLVIYLHGFQPALDEAVAQAGVTALDVASLVPLIDDGGEGHDESGEDARADPHVWLDPTRLATVGDAVAARLAELDPGGAAEFQERAQTLRDELTALDGEFADGLRDCQRREIVVSHAAFGYLADRYDLRHIPITGLSPDTEPTPGQLEAAVEVARDVGATTIFFETLVNPAVAEAVADAVGADTAVLDPIEGLWPGTEGDYLSVMRTNLATLRPALGCA
jgi:zinc transport system substrate-binding protein